MNDMKHYVDVPRNYIDKVVDSISCDICGEVHPHDHWKKDAFEVLETEVSITTGVQYPEGGDRHIVSFDICPKCFNEKLIPFLESLGAKPSTDEKDYW